MFWGIPSPVGANYTVLVLPAYLDHAATTPVRPRAAEAFGAVSAALGNPSSIHSFGRDVRRVVDDAREQVADLLGAEPAEVIFTSGGTEADNLAIIGGWFARRGARPGLATTTIEHPAVLESSHWLAEEHGAELHLLDVGTDGALDVAAAGEVISAQREAIGLISVMWANNETGVIQPLEPVIELAAAHGIAVHSDAVQAAGHLPIDFRATGLHALSISGHKLGAPVGVGALLARRDFQMRTHMHGGGQERGVRSGTINAAGAAALAAALEDAVRGQETESARLARLRDELQDGIRAAVPQARVWGADAARLPSHLLVSIPGTRSEAVLFALDMAGIAASAGSACQAGVVGASPVVLAMGGTEADARGALRFTLGHTSTRTDIARVLQDLPGAVARAQAAF